MVSFRNPQFGLIGAITTICWAVLFPSDAIADEVPGDDPFCVERPGQTTPPCLVKPRSVMIETGIATWTHSRAENDRLNEVATGATTVRYGVAPQLELQLGWAGLISSSHTASDMRVQSHSTNVGDMTVGALYNFSGQDGPAALQVYFALPTGKGEASKGDWSGGVRLPLAAALDGHWSVGVTPEFDLAANASGSGRHSAFSCALGISRAVAGRLGASLDVSVIEDRDPKGVTTIAVSSGSLAWQASSNSQLDIGVGLGLTASSPRVQVYIGFAKRL